MKELSALADASGADNKDEQRKRNQVETMEIHGSFIVPVITARALLVRKAAGATIAGVVGVLLTVVTRKMRLLELVERPTPEPGPATY